MKKKSVLILARNLLLAFFLLLAIAGGIYITATTYFANHYIREHSQILNRQLAKHLIDEKFKTGAPFTKDGAVNKEFFGDLMHDMMAINRAIEVYLLDNQGKILYSVVLNEIDSTKTLTSVDLQPIRTFLASENEDFILGDDPCNKNYKNIFSAATYDYQGKQGYLYITLAGKEFSKVTFSLLKKYGLVLTIGFLLLTMLLTIIFGWMIMKYLIRDLKNISHKVAKFKDGDLSSRINESTITDLGDLGTNFNTMADTIVDNMEKIKAVEDFRRELIANISHDLRSPLAVMSGYVETIQIKNETLSVHEREKYLNILANSTKKLTKLVDQLFEYSKLEANQIQPIKERFQLIELISDIIAQYENISKTKNISIVLNAPSQVPLVFADIHLVDRVFQNLIDNALKFTPIDGKIIIHVSSNDANIGIEIEDNGPGIAIKDQPYIFDRYKTTNNKENIAGTGLGLAIVKKILEIHNSTISVVNSEVKGAIFKFNLPLAHL